MASALYGAAHQRERKAWEPKVRAGQVTCWRCGRSIVPLPWVRGEGWDLGHRPGLPSLPEHARQCNRSAGGRVGAMITNAKRRRRVSAPRHSRAW